MTKTPIGVFRDIVNDYNVPRAIKDPDGSFACGYIVTDDELKQTFMMHGFNTKRAAWKDYIDIWVEGNLLRQVPFTGKYYITEHGFKLIGVAGNRMPYLQSVVDDKALRMLS